MIVQFGGQTPLNLASDLEAHGVNIIGTSPSMIDAAEDRNLFRSILERTDLKQPDNRIANSQEQAYELAGEIGFPILLRPSFVLGGRGMFIVYDMQEMKNIIREVFDAAPGKPVLLDKFLEDAYELDVDCICDGETSVIGGILQHVEFAGVHSVMQDGNATSYTFQRYFRESTQSDPCTRRELQVVGLMNVQYAIKNDELFIIEVNPRASRTVPFVSKAIGVPLAKLAARVMAGKTQSPQIHKRNYSSLLGGQRIGFPIWSFYKNNAKPRNALYRRSYGHRQGSRCRLRKVTDGGKTKSTRQRRCIY